LPTILIFGVRNLGRAVGAHFAAQGWRVAGVARTQETIDAFRTEIPDALGFAVDAASEDDVQRVLAEVGDVDAIVNAITDWPTGGSITELGQDAAERYFHSLVPAIFNVLRLGCRQLAEQGRGTFVQTTGGSARRGVSGRSTWAASAMATRALTQSAADELRAKGVHVALLVIDAVIESEKVAGWIEDLPKNATAAAEDCARAIEYLVSQTERGWTHELLLTPAGERWVP
jgi:NADP-dependent 3-hydroxy acid dehydrogenase YdfG